MPTVNKSPTDPTQYVSQVAKRGVLFITTAKGWFLISGLLLQLLLPRALGSPEAFGVWSLVVAWMSGFSNVLVTGTIQTMARFSQTGREEEAKVVGLRLQLIVGTTVALLFFLAAPWIAQFGHDATYTTPLRIASLILFFYSVYAVFVGSANGLKLFQKQAGLDMVFATLRVSLVLGAAWVFHRTLASVTGFALASALITVLAVFWVGPPRSLRERTSLSLRSMAGYLGWIVLFLLPFNLVMFVDTYLLKRLATQFMEGSHTLSPEAIKTAADALVGLYGAAQNIARLPYQLMIAAAFVVFPILSQAAIAQDRQRATAYTAATLRYSLMAVVAMAVGLGVRPQGSLRLLFAPEYMAAADAFALLLLAYIGYALMSIVATLLNGLGHQKDTALLSFSTLIVTVVCVLLGLHQKLQAAPTGLAPTSVLVGSARGMLLGVGLGLGGFLLVLWRRQRVSFIPLSLLRVGLAAVPSLALGWIWPAVGTAGWMGGKLGTLVCSMLSILLYLGILLLSKELSLSALRQARRPTFIPPKDQQTEHVTQ